MKCLEIPRPKAQLYKFSCRMNKKLGKWRFITATPITLLAIVLFLIGATFFKIGQLGRVILNFIGLDPFGVWEE